MRLNYDCVRDVLLALEDLLTCEYMNDIAYFNDVSIDDLNEALNDKGYSKETIFYSAYNLGQAKFIVANTVPGDNGIMIIQFRI